MLRAAPAIAWLVTLAVLLGTIASLCVYAVVG